MPEEKWDNLVQNEGLDKPLKEKWKTIYQICFYSILDNNLIRFQYRILNQILGTKSYLKKIKISSDDICSFCSVSGENIEHLFYECTKVSQLWDNVQRWVRMKTGVNITLTPTMKIIGYMIKDRNFWPLNLILTTTRKYIFWCSKKNFELNLIILIKCSF